jgi:hypothetical protein
MAFNSNAVRTSNASAANNNTSSRVAGYLNAYLPRKDGSRMKLGAFAFVPERNDEHQALIDFIRANPEEALQTVIDAIQYEFNDVSEKTPEKTLSFL